MSATARDALPPKTPRAIRVDAWRLATAGQPAALTIRPGGISGEPADDADLHSPERQNTPRVAKLADSIPQ
ncbi:hypothetical protein GDN83_15045 [Gordonia jinghuaiqii]|uniref:Uncharacterized protein n=1 Tax=Gordonia jinghuaiqii TaxID=2758710 RepID=A0A7D7LRK7_9ACTN|nr:hypothetical protein [Gordonia jinghuaiqii]MCR5979030.1 hypothetical protein [Gordonia jinghuaiqii]QMT01645.1 hypothetical protein H1R19_23060 [Gordonia jinghuaiqii]